MVVDRGSKVQSSLEYCAQRERVLPPKAAYQPQDSACSRPKKRKTRENDFDLRRRFNGKKSQGKDRQDHMRKEELRAGTHQFSVAGVEFCSTSDCRERRRKFFRDMVGPRARAVKQANSRGAACRSESKGNDSVRWLLVWGTRGVLLRTFRASEMQGDDGAYTSGVLRILVGHPAEINTKEVGNSREILVEHKVVRPAEHKQNAETITETKRGIADGERERQAEKLLRPKGRSER
ncbi:hypothetical protein C8R43DRAFT_1112117 [Mycena crocata]|nr:hypothetical protein C8R43DRAFT_1112117 [Mycena crocata]